MKYTKVPRGVAMSTRRVAWRIAPLNRGGRPGLDNKLQTSDIPKLRELLRTGMSIEQIGVEMGCSHGTLRKFIRQRNLCDLTARRNFITLQRSLAKLPEEA